MRRVRSVGGEIPQMTENTLFRLFVEVPKHKASCGVIRKTREYGGSRPAPFAKRRPDHRVPIAKWLFINSTQFRLVLKV